MQTALKLRPYQRDGVRWLVNDKPHKLLADDMGLGKTVQCIAALNVMQSRRVVIVCPATVKIMWARQLARFWKGTGRVQILNGLKANIEPHAQVIILNYRLLIEPGIQKQLSARGLRNRYDVVIFDESRAMKSVDAQTTIAGLGADSFIHFANRIWCLDGTPVPNRTIELYPVVYTLAPEVLDPYHHIDAYKDYFCHRWQRDGLGDSNTDELAQRLEQSGFYLRRTKEQVMADLPDKIETVVELDIIPPCDTSDTPIATVRRELALAKLDDAETFVRQMAGEQGKVVVFAHHRDVITGLRDRLEDEGAVIVYGGMTAEQKQVSIDAFVNDPNTKVLIGQTVAGGSGVDGLQDVCSNIVFVELDWSPGVMDQAVDRCRRIGQRKEAVFVYYLSVPDSLDTQMDGALVRKRTVINKLIREVNNMSFSPEVEAAVINLLNALTTVLGGNAVAPAAPAAAKGGKGKKDQTPDPVVNAAPPAAPAAPAGPTKEDVLKAYDKFLAQLEGDALAQAKEVIRDKINYPITGVKMLKEMDPKFYGDVITALEAGLAYYLPKAAPPSDDI